MTISLTFWPVLAFELKDVGCIVRIHNNTVLDAVQVILKCLIDFITVSLFGSNKTFIVALVCHTVFVYLSFMQ